MIQDQERLAAAQLPEGSVIAVLLEQHARLRDLFEAVRSAQGACKQVLFDELRGLLAVHEAGEQMVLRPVSKDIPISKDTAGQEVVEARNHEEEQAAGALAELEKVNVRDPVFDTRFARFERTVSEHVDNEEGGEFVRVLIAVDARDQLAMGRRLSVAAQRVARTGPHPHAVGTTAPRHPAGAFASLVDNARDALGGRQD